METQDRSSVTRLVRKETTVPKPAYAASLVLAIPLMLLGCTPAEERGAATPTSSTTTAAPSASPTPTVAPPSTTPPAEEPKRSARGNIIRKAGERFGFTENGEQAARFLVSAITVDPKCTDPYAEAPEFGHFVRMDIKGSTTTALTQDIFIAGGAWFAVTQNGMTFNGDPWNMAAAGCLKETERLPSIIGPGERVEGAVLLDVPTEHGVIVLDLGDGLAWEWAY